MYNPRFPHSLKVLRPELDSNGSVVYDADGNVNYLSVPLDIVKTIDSDPQFDVDGRMITSQACEVNFGYRTSSLNSSKMGEVVVSDFRIACPMFITELTFDDVLVLTDYDRTYRGRLVKKSNSNWGTNIWFDEIRN